MRFVGIFLLFSTLAYCFGSPIFSPNFAQPQKLKFSDRVNSILANLTIEEKVGQMTQLNINLFVKDLNPYEIDMDKLRLYATKYYIGSILNSPTSNAGYSPTAEQWVKMLTDIQSVFTTEGTKIPTLFGIDSVHGFNYMRGAVMFPQQLNMAASFNRDIAVTCGSVTAKDTRIVGIPWTFSPILDIALMPNWPRVYETFGEDPYLASEMGVAIIKGYQGFPADLKNPVKVAACLKHFIGYSNSRTGKDQNPTWIPDRYLYDYFVPPFQAAINIGAATVMESYTDINGEPVVASSKYLKTLLREQMGFNGMLVTDWAEIIELKRFHKVAENDREAVRMVMERTSIDMSMVPDDVSFFDNLVQLVREGAIPESRLDEGAGRIIQLKEDLGLLDNAFPDPKNPLLAEIGGDADRKAALDACRESIILAENKGILPLNVQNTKKILVAGPTGDSISYMSGGWSINWQGAADVFFDYGVTVFQGIKNVVGSNSEVVYKRGCGIDGKSFSGEIDEVLQEAQNSDVIILGLGEDHYAERFGDISDLTLPKGQIELLEALTATGKPVVVVLFEGRPRILTSAVNSAQAVLAAFLPGPEGGQAVAEILFGLVNPSARMPLSYPKETGNVPLTYYHKVTEKSDFQWAFGHGLSYTTFTYSNLIVTPQVSPRDIINISFNVANTGVRDGKEVVLIYVSDLVRQIVPEVKMLKRFDKVSLKAGQTLTLNFSLTVDDLKFTGVEGQKIYEYGRFTVQVGNLQSDFVLVPSL